MADFVEFIFITKSAYYYNMSYQVPLGYVPISSSALRPLGAAYIPILLSEVEQEQRPSGNGDREAIVVGAGLCDGEGERAYTAYAPHYTISASPNAISPKVISPNVWSFRLIFLGRNYSTKFLGGMALGEMTCIRIEDHIETSICRNSVKTFISYNDPLK